jgi:hypothetical protein
LRGGLVARHGQYSSAPRIIQIPQHEQPQRARLPQFAPRQAAALGGAGDHAPAAALRPDVVAPRLCTFIVAGAVFERPEAHGADRAVLAGGRTVAGAAAAALA